MKKQFEKILNELGISKFRYSSNWDDTYSGFEFNPNERVLIRLLFALTPDESDESENPNLNVRIDLYSVNIFDNTVHYREIISGQVISDDMGEIDYNFYKTLLKHWRNFSI